MILQALGRHLLEYCRVGSVVPIVHDPLQSPPVLRGAVAETGSDASCQDAVHRTSVEGLKDPPGDSELLQLPEVGEEVEDPGT